MARFQTLRRWYEALPDPAPALPFARKLLEIVEHTRGLDEKMNLFAPFLLFAQICTGAVCANCSCVFKDIFPLFV